jgi:E3 ubiquitin-protein ligase DOA10
MASICRICLEEEAARALIAPCKCTGKANLGSQQYVHLSCLLTWQDTVLATNTLLPSAAHRQIDTCPVCQAEYHIEFRHVEQTLWSIFCSPLILISLFVLLVAFAAVHSWVLTYKLRMIADSMDLLTHMPNLIAVRPT